MKIHIHAASLYPSQWVRRFVRSAGKQPGKAVELKPGQLGSSLHALSLLFPAALPSMSERDLSDHKQRSILCLRRLLGAVLDLDNSSFTFSEANISHVKKLLAPGHT